ncbi:MAG TPA: DNA recombination protein RmuC [Enteractinococcus helveticum]|uniref:DNA recombination protein RmuC n=1 Tax=Enteractinococcus helveticum TaxID=1837282 RepID=A0A921K7S5_9MICC|nr:DNA recombination protein RmuC [Enteractinococcus helveticum]HJF14962.1 DNA recombination protein RmuC [Enteractinococcus helveticum]
MEISTAIVLCILIAVLFFIIGYVVAKRTGGGPSDGTTEAALREQLATAQTRADLLERQRTEDREQFQSQHQIVQMLGPLAQQLDHLGTQVAQLERDRGQQYGQLSQQLRTAHLTDAALLENTQKLVASLRSSSARGHWGEVQLRRIVEAAGMLQHTDFEEQVSLLVNTAERDGEQFRPDMLVHLPGGKSLIVDAKAPMSAILQAAEIPADGSEEDQRRRAELEAAHTRALRAHVKDLGTKKYWHALDNTPDLVLLFLPAESHLSAALEADAELLDYAFSQGVALVSPVSLLATLKSVAYAWQQETLVDNARTVFASARELYERLGLLGRRLDSLGKSINTTVTRFNSMMATLEGRVLPSARRLEELDASLDAIAVAEPVQQTARDVTAPELQANIDATGGKTKAE